MPCGEIGDQPGPSHCPAPSQLTMIANPSQRHPRPLPLQTMMTAAYPSQPCGEIKDEKGPPQFLSPSLAKQTSSLRWDDSV
jgi:hypothetical protein